MLNNLNFAILTLNEEKNIKKALNSIPKESLKNTTIYDGGSNDQTKHISKKFKVKFISLPGSSIERRRYQAINDATKKFICFLDADQYFDSNTNFEQINSIFEDDPDIAGLQFKLNNGNLDNSYWAKGFGVRHNFIHNSQKDKNVIGTPCIFRISIFKNVAYKDGITGSSDDTLACLRVRERGYKFRSVNIVAYENVRSSFKDTLKKSFWYGRGDYEYITKLRVKRNIYNHLFHVFVRNPLIMPTKALFSKNFIYFPFFIIFGLSRVTGFIYGLIKNEDMSNQKT